MGLLELPQYLHANVVGAAPITCCSCGILLTRPVQLQPCGHVVCYDCSLKFYESCPSCGQIITSADSDKLMLGDIMSQRVRCECGQEMCLQQYLQAHVSGCAQALIACPNGCHMCFTQDQKTDHLKNHCLMRMVSCQFCGIILTYQELEQHIMQCPNVKIKCHACDKEFYKHQLAKHYEHCQEVEIECQLCEIKIRRKELLQHMSDPSNMGAHFLAIQQTFLDTQKQFKVIHQELNQKVSSLEQKIMQLWQPPIPHRGSTSFNTVQNVNSTAVPRQNSELLPSPQASNMVRRSLRVIPGQQNGTERVNSTVMILPDEMYANNEYQLGSAPPNERAYLKIVSNTSKEELVIRPTLKRNSIYYKVMLQQGEYTIRLCSADDDQELDSQDVTILRQQFENTTEQQIGHCFGYGPPVRQFLRITEQAKQRYYLKLQFCNCFFGIGVSSDNDRALDEFQIVSNDGLLIRKSEGRPLQQEMTNMRMARGDLIEVALNIKNEELLIKNHDEQLVVEFPRDWHLYIEVVDAEVILL